MITIKTENEAINWLLEKATYKSELTQDDIDDGCSKFIIGQFQGSLPYRMAEDVKQFGIKNGGCKYTGKGRIDLMRQEKDGVEESITIVIKFGSTKRSGSTINFMVDHIVETVK